MSFKIRGVDYLIRLVRVTLALIILCLLWRSFQFRCIVFATTFVSISLDRFATTVVSILLHRICYNIRVHFVASRLLRFSLKFRCIVFATTFVLMAFQCRCNVTPPFRPLRRRLLEPSVSNELRWPWALRGRRVQVLKRVGRRRLHAACLPPGRLWPRRLRFGYAVQV